MAGDGQGSARSDGEGHLKRFQDVDFVAGLGAVLWAIMVTLLPMPSLGALIDGKAAIAFALTAFARWGNKLRKEPWEPKGKFLHVDFLFALGAITWTIAVNLLQLDALAHLVDPSAAAVFAVAAFGRWLADQRATR